MSMEGYSTIFQFCTRPSLEGEALGSSKTTTYLNGTNMFSAGRVRHFSVGATSVIDWYGLLTPFLRSWMSWV
jgi:hypothetical protein